jgi:micrococcal nuclease
MTKRRITTTFSLLVAFLLVLLNEIKLSNQTNEPSQKLKFEVTQATQSTESLKDTREGPYKVVKVVDGDTIEAFLDEKITKIRIIGLNTPETVDPRKKVECFGKEASTQANVLLNNKLIYLESDPTQQNTDKYGRLLRYIFLEDGTNFAEWMIKNGYGYEYTYDNPYKYRDLFKQAQNDAENNQKGLWAENACKN